MTIRSSGDVRADALAREVEQVTRRFEVTEWAMTKHAEWARTAEENAHRDRARAWEVMGRATLVTDEDGGMVAKVAIEDWRELCEIVRFGV